MSKRQPDAAGVLAFLWDHFDATAASDEGLQYLSGAADEAAHAALELSSHIAALGGLIERDRGFEGKPQCGELQDADQAALLYRIADEVKVIGQLVHVGNEADSVLRARMTQKLAAGRSRRATIPEQSSTLEEV
ncbi:TPA: hypothetical protein QDB24_002858 [Burkholderia vietnamiensis]|uniref:hypothetical protein n=1 Tax=Burkholderia vietnamiensis TaxID=60552 RepID=UPI001B98C151|nr:hypothetical protein [Burkholderia vietnamiensis]MBR7909110.1 hypothetical protein [Burkholderia vietnamiensis]HDR9274784.1 hypothetical protein [Burkholderia vietnamiensis]